MATPVLALAAWDDDVSPLRRSTRCRRHRSRGVLTHEQLARQPRATQRRTPARYGPVPPPGPGPRHRRRRRRLGGPHADVLPRLRLRRLRLHAQPARRFAAPPTSSRPAATRRVHLYLRVGTGSWTNGFVARLRRPAGLRPGSRTVRHQRAQLQRVNCSARRQDRAAARARSARVTTASVRTRVRHVDSGNGCSARRSSATPTHPCPSGHPVAARQARDAGLS